MGCSRPSEGLLLALGAVVLCAGAAPLRAEPAQGRDFLDRVVVPLRLGTAALPDLDAASALVPRLAASGAGALHLSPLLAGTLKPPHAVQDHLRVEPALGGEAAFARLVTAAQTHGLMLAVDLHANDVSTEHESFRAARAGDRFHRSLFILSDAPPAPPKRKTAVVSWTFDEALGAHYYHAYGPGRADLDLRDPALRARIIAFAEAWHRRGVDAFVVPGARTLVEDPRGATLDRPENVGFLRELRAKLPGHVALIAGLEARSPVAARYFGAPDDAADLVFEQDRRLGFEVALEAGTVEVLASAIERAERLRPDRSRWSLRAFEEASPGAAEADLWSAFLLTVGGQPWLEPGALDLELVSALLRLRGLHPALVGGRFEPVSGAPPGSLIFLRRDGLDAVLVALSFAERQELVLSRLGEAGAEVDLDAALSAKAEVSRSDGRVQLEKGGVFVAPLRRASPPLVVEMMREAGARTPRSVIAESGAAFDPVRGAGFGEDRHRRLSCGRASKGGERCAMPFEGSVGYTPGTRYSVSVPAGVYRVLVVPRGAPARGAFLVEGERAEPTKAGLERLVFVRDGVLSVEAEPETKSEVSRIQIHAEAPGVIQLVAEPDRGALRIEAPMAGELLWRMDDASYEPVERTPLVKSGRGYSARLGPWPPGVREIRIILRDAKGRLYAGEGGQEIVFSRPSAD